MPSQMQIKRRIPRVVAPRVGRDDAPMIDVFMTPALFTGAGLIFLALAVAYALEWLAQ